MRQAKPAKETTKTTLRLGDEDEDDDDDDDVDDGDGELIREERKRVTEAGEDQADLLEAKDAHQKQLSTESSWRQASSSRSNGHQSDISSLSWLCWLSAGLVAHITIPSR